MMLLVKILAILFLVFIGLVGLAIYLVAYLWIHDEELSRKEYEKAKENAKIWKALADTLNELERKRLGIKVQTDEEFQKEVNDFMIARFFRKRNNENND